MQGSNETKIMGLDDVAEWHFEFSVWEDVTIGLSGFEIQNLTLVFDPPDGEVLSRMSISFFPSLAQPPGDSWARGREQNTILHSQIFTFPTPS